MDSSRVDTLLKEYEASGLRTSIYARITFVVFGGGLALWNTGSLEALLPSVLLIVVGLGLQLYCLNLVRQRRRHLFVGRILCLFDCFTLLVFPPLWYWSEGGPELTPAFLVKNDQVPWFALMMVINALAMRPMYPQLVAFTGVVQHIGFAVYAASDPRVKFEIDHVQHHLAETVNPLSHAWIVLSIALLGVFLAWFGAWARQSIRAAAELEAANLEIQEAQAQRIMEAKVGALANLVAGMAHEINNPLGVMSSSADTSARSAERISEVIGAAGSLEQLREDRKLEKALGVLKQSTQAIGVAAERINELVDSLKDFSRLDQAEEIDADLHRGLDSTISLVDAALKANVTIDRRYGDIPKVRCKAKAINQVFMTLIENALEAMSGSGQLTLTTGNGGASVFVEIEDDGPGMTPAQQTALFDVSLINRPDRVAVRLGLPAAQLIVREHGGLIDVQSEAGRGTKFRIELPVARQSKT